MCSLDMHLTTHFWSQVWADVLEDAPRVIRSPMRDVNARLKQNHWSGAQAFWKITRKIVRKIMDSL